MIHIYGNCARIFAMDLAYNDKKLRDSCNPNEPLNSPYTRLNECVDYAAAAGNPITEGQFIRISYVLVVEMGQFQEDCRA